MVSKKWLFIHTLIAFLIFSVSSFAYQVTPTYYDFGNVNASKLYSTVFNFTLTNESLNLSTTLPEYMVITPSLLVADNETKSFDVTLILNPPSDGKQHIEYIMINGTKYIPIFFNVVSTTQTQTTTTTAPSQSNESCRLEAYITKYKFSIPQNTTKKYFVSVKSYCNEKIYIKDLIPTGDIFLTEKGWQPLDVEASLGTIDPNGETTYVVIIDTTNVPTGSYNVQTLLVGVTQSGTKVSASTQWEITITKSLTSPQQPQQNQNQQPQQNQTQQVLNPLSIFISPSSPNADDEATISAMSYGSVCSNCSIFVDDNLIGKGEVKYKFSEGTHTIRAEGVGYETATKTITVEKALTVLKKPESLELNKEAVIELNKNVKWAIYYTDAKGTQKVAEDTSSIISFKPTAYGNYTIVAEGKTLAFYSIASPLPQVQDLITYAVGILVVVGIFYLIIKAIRGKKKKRALVLQPIAEAIAVKPLSKEEEEEGE